MGAIGEIIKKEQVSSIIMGDFVKDKRVLSQESVLSAEQIAEFQTVILDYYKENAREFPWRQTRDAYRILVSELMLQQTQTERVVQKYDEWLKAFPSVEAVSAAGLSAVLEKWSGLGYNRRARFLQNACTQIVQKHGGVVPQSVEELEALSGIGPYTARAVATFAYNKAEVFIETNIRSLYLFFFFKDKSDVTDKMILPLIEQTLYRPNPRLWYYALMDYGADLKKRVQNPNRKSAHYTKQSKFTGSLREGRGAILRALVGGAGLTIEQIAQAEKIESARLCKAATALQSEGFICEENGVYRICDG